MYRVLVRKHRNEAIVRPPFEFIERRKKFEVRNGTKDKIFVTVPPDVFEEERKRGKPARTASGAYVVRAGDKLELTVLDDAEKGAYSFQIFCDETHTYAQANSDPEFIVE
jgi:hypothetical protein